ncbi:uncharacterized protein [Elaeis guineensis]|uniref:uncharacterized protein n=1 Tax=Elaeis guineensis var. tenera TaxID=51953 RepID=UPI003C6D11B9
MEVVGLFLLSPAADEMTDERSTQVFKGMDRCSSTTAERPLKGWRECSIKDCIRCSLKEHGCLEGLYMINRASGPIIDLQLSFVEAIFGWLTVSALPCTLEDPVIQLSFPGYNNHRQIMASDPFLSTFQEAQEEALSNLYVANNGDMVNGNVPYSRNMPHVGNVSYDGSSGNADLGEHFMGTSLPATSLVNLVSGTTCLRENLISVDAASTSSLPSKEMRTSISSDCCNTINSSKTVSVNCEFELQDDAGLLTSKKDACLNQQLNCSWNYDVLGPEVPSGKTFASIRPSYHELESSVPGWKSSVNFPYLFHDCVPCNELSLSLGSGQPSIISMPEVLKQCSEASCPGIITSDNSRCPVSTEMPACSHASGILLMMIWLGADLR